MKKSLRPLSLHRETLHNLQKGELTRAAAAFVTGKPCTVECTVTVCGSCKVICE